MIVLQDLFEQKAITKLPKINIPEIKSKIFAPAPGGTLSTDGKTVSKPIVPPMVMEKWRKFSIKEHFSSETLHGRANVCTIFTS